MSSKRKRSSQSQVALAIVGGASESEDAGAGAGAGHVAGAGPVTGTGEVGRLVDSSQADDRRMIRLVRDRPLLYARNNMPVASYYTHVKTLWREVADEMGWTVADVRRKWSHIRNSYSRHLRNEMYGVRTGRGRMVSKWYLADELDFLREHMATDTRPSRYSYPSLYMDMEVPGCRRRSRRFNTGKCSPNADAMDLKPYLPTPWFSTLTSQTKPDPSEPLVDVHESTSPRSFEPDENSAYFQFFRGIYNDYQELPPKKQRFFRRECLSFLHRLLDDEDATYGGEPEEGQRQHDAMNMSSSAADSDDERDVKPCLLTVEHSLAVMPN